MKYINIIITLFIAGILLCSCQDFLAENPTTSLSESAVISTESTLEAQVIGCLEPLHSIFKSAEYAEYTTIAAGVASWKTGRNTTEWLDAMYLTKFSTTQNGNLSVWNKIWPGINRCNTLIANLPKSPVKDEYKLEIEAETKLIRCILLYTATQFWGDVPLKLAPPTSQTDVNPEREAWYKVYIQIIKDLEFAEQNMRDYDKQEAINPEQNRPCKWAATALKANVYLQIATLIAHPDDNFWDSSKDAQLIAEGRAPRTPDFSEINISSPSDAFKLAYDTADKVIDQGPYTLCKDYRQLFRWTEHEDFFLKEGIFVLPSSPSSSFNGLWERCMPPYYKTTINISNACRCYVSRYAYDRAVKYSGGSMYDGSDPLAEGLYCQSSDPRIATSFATSYVNESTGKTVKCYPDPSMITSTNKANACPFYIKHYSPCATASTNASLYYLRLAEMYLIRAEAAANLSSGIGDSYWESAITNVNTLRQRARASHDASEAAPDCPPDWATNTYSTKEDLILAIFWERYIEMNWECHEWADTHRMGAGWLSKYYAKPMNSFYVDNPNMKTFREAEYKDMNGQCYIYDPTELRKSLLMGFPQKEIELNTSISGQNDFYWQ